MPALFNLAGPPHSFLGVRAVHPVYKCRMDSERDSHEVARLYIAELVF